MVTGLIAALLSSAPIALSPAVNEPLQQATPAMWVVRDHDTTIYLFGTFHALDGRSNWFNHQVREAFSKSDELVLETVLPRRRTAGMHGVAGVRRDPRMSSLSVTSGASFLASTRMAVSAGRDRGLQVSKGADMVLHDVAEIEGKRVSGLESLEFQRGMFDSMAPVLPPAARPVQTREAQAQLAAMMLQMQAAWNQGDQRVFAALLSDMRRTSPDNYRMMFPERNAHWADWIVDRMDQPGTVFVAVGAGHFAGPDSVQSKLTLKGLVATRAN